MAWLHVHYHSEVLEMPTAMEVLLPEFIAGKDRRVDTPGPYPTLYLLHGMGDDHTAWMRRTSIERYLERLPLAVVMPAGQLGWYTDMACGKRYFTFITEELPRICERMFPLSPTRRDRFIAGISMGGYGAIKAGLRAPDVFGKAASLSGAVDIQNTLSRLDPQLAQDVFGNTNEIKGSRNDLFTVAKDLANASTSCPELYLWCGTDDYFYPDNLRFKSHLAQLNLPFTYEEGPGDHQWEHWDRQLKRLIEWIMLPSKTG
ncbi:MAG TPA: alpha/beta hydrolase family protein [Bacillota bacterium]|nr:alpha/beta hydrolase family protein [Bacillota bacterium]HPT88192.1 alpha/beta hydrolase family protein [Bacillota bacterium]